MAISGFLFLSTRLLQIITLIPILGILASFVHTYVRANALTPTYILVLFITSVLAAAWAIATTITYLRARHSALFVALVDLAFVGALIAGVYELRGWAGANCTHTSGYANSSGIGFGISTNKTCALLKACFALGIIDIILFFITFVSALPFDVFAAFSFSLTPNPIHSYPLLPCLAPGTERANQVPQLLALLVARHHRNDDRVVVKREYHSSRHGHRRGGSRGGSYDGGYRPSSGGRRSHRSSSRRQYYV